MKIELHLLQNFPPSNLNRDDSGAPKDCEFGGYRRARVSSQCFKRTTRKSRLFEQELEDRVGLRTKRAPKAVGERLVEKHQHPEGQAKAAALAFFDALFGVTEKELTQYLLYIGPDELDQITQLLHEHFDEIGPAALELVNERAHLQAEQERLKKEGKKKKEIEKQTKDLADAIQKREAVFAKLATTFVKAHPGHVRAVDVGLFGRMLAHKPELNVDAAAQVAHAISTNRVNMEFDYYTAVDDLKPDDTAGADMIGTVPFNSACYYRYACVDARSLAENVGGKEKPDHGAAREGIAAFMKAFIRAVPSGKQNSFATPMRPSLVLAVIRPESQPLSLANAFEQPASPHGEVSLVADSVARLGRHWAALKKMYPDDAYGYFALLEGAGDAAKLAEANLEDMTSADAVVERVLQDLVQWQTAGGASA